MSVWKEDNYMFEKILDENEVLETFNQDKEVQHLLVYLRDFIKSNQSIKIVDKRQGATRVQRFFGAEAIDCDGLVIGFVFNIETTDTMKGKVVKVYSYFGSMTQYEAKKAGIL